MESKKINVISIHGGPHRVHYAWMKSVSGKLVPFVPRFFGKNADYQDKIRITNRFFKINTVQQLFAVFQSFFVPKADVYLVESISSLIPAILNKRKNTKIIMINSNIFFYDIERASPFMKSIYMKYLSYVDGIISSSEMIRSKSKEYTKVPNVIVNPFYEDKFKKIKADLGSKNIIYVGRFSGEKNIGFLLKIFSLIGQKNKDKLFLVGCSEKAAEEFKKIPGVVPVTWTNEVEKYLSRCGLYIHTGGPDAFGVSVIEAMATGMPSIVTKLCGAKEVVEKVTKELVIDFDAAKVAKLIDKINSDGKLKSKLGKESLKAVENLTEKRSIYNFKKEFYELVNSI